MGKINQRKTTEEFINQLKIIQPDIDVIGNYINSKTAIEMHCNIHDLTFGQIPSKALIGQCGCKICGIQRGKRYKKTHEQFINEMITLHPNIIVLDTYNGATFPVSCECKVCGHRWNGIPNNLLKGSGCIICGNRRSGGVRGKTNQQFLEELSKITLSIVPLEEYVNAYTKILVECEECGKRWKVNPHSLLRGSGCRECSAIKAGLRRRKTHEQFISEMSELHPELIIHTQYIDSWTKISCTCKQCNRTFNVSPADILHRDGCPKCNVDHLPQRQPKALQTFMNDLYAVHKTIEIIGEYTKASNRVDVKCTVCGHEWSPVGTSLTSGTGCPICSQSHGERNIAKYLADNNIFYIAQKTFDSLVGVGGGLLSYDFYLPQYNLLVEYQGEYHDGTVPIQTEIEFLKQQEHDKRKRLYAEQHNIKLLEIWYWDSNSIESILNNVLQNPVTTTAI